MDDYDYAICTRLWELLPGSGRALFGALGAFGAPNAANEVVASLPRRWIYLCSKTENLTRPYDSPRAARVSETKREINREDRVARPRTKASLVGSDLTIVIRLTRHPVAWFSLLSECESIAHNFRLKNIFIGRLFTPPPPPPRCSARHTSPALCINYTWGGF
jgi:hypothetical protein